MPDYFQTRSFLYQNLDTILETMTAIKQQNQNFSDDLFATTTEEAKNIISWQPYKKLLSQKEVLLKEKESLGIYVSGNPLESYRELLEQVREITNREDIFLVLLDKIKKIFTKTNSMMFALEISVLDTNLEGVIFPKNALRLSSIIKEKEICWVVGKIQLKKKKKAKKVDLELEQEDKKYEDLPKLIIEDLVDFSSGPLPLFETDEIKLPLNRIQQLESLDWEKLLLEPDCLHTKTKTIKENPKTGKSKNQVKISIVKLPISLGLQKLKAIKDSVQNKPTPNHLPVQLEIQTKNGYQKVKGIKYLPNHLISELNKSIQV